jgi:hypothetical protein
MKTQCFSGFGISDRTKSGRVQPPHHQDPYRRAEREHPERQRPAEAAAQVGDGTTTAADDARGTVSARIDLGMRKNRGAPKLGAPLRVSRCRAP